ncbi:hypothetical protein [Pseudomonas carnis]|uniref:hypothetical protein n=1 Tax=Pseudomonas carnis TaxID=2487355 RepID=UPI001DC95CFE|nr:hypothetical protein [Pseudomonas carnis]CAH0239395.1 hypothetical protein SRABI111_02874 [Pseudomonas carnis]CAH0285095.1 hypothetical protein SRABI08_04017 [Pseudomonas carnis]CAH0308406.1 hypothetical protein SRABI110_04951 [Pseudomonas carnis]CAH0314971.1 hypothetical protein SRABI64_04971 [Pseudomonas carnis]
MPARADIDIVVRKALTESVASQSNGLAVEDINNITIYGMDGLFDSLQLVTLMMRIEELIADKFDLSLSLTSDRAISRKVSPFQSPSILVDFVMEEILALETAK